MRREKMESLVTEKLIDMNCSRGRSRGKFSDRTAVWLHSANVTNLLIATKEKEV